MYYLTAQLLVKCMLSMYIISKQDLRVSVLVFVDGLGRGGERKVDKA